MDTILMTMIPIVMLIFFGYLLKTINFVPNFFWEITNRVVFYIGVPCIIFHSTYFISYIPYFDIFNFCILGGSIVVLFFFTRFFCYLSNMPVRMIGSVCQCSLHSNIGYIGLPVIFYYMGYEGIAKSSFVTSFTIIVQNFVSIIGFSFENTLVFKKKFSHPLLNNILTNPVIISSIFGILFSTTNFVLPKYIDNIFNILSGLSLPMALLIIGGSLTYVNNIRQWLLIAFYVSFVKLFLLPAFVVFIFYYNYTYSYEMISFIILLASPTATVSCIVAKEMGGDVNLSAIMVSLTTVVSIFSIFFWLKFLAI